LKLNYVKYAKFSQSARCVPDVDIRVKEQEKPPGQEKDRECPFHRQLHSSVPLGSAVSESGSRA